MNALPYFIASLGTALAGAIITRKSLSSEWYARLKKPSWQPTTLYFTVIWTIIYIILAWATYTATQKHKSCGVVILFILNLFTNTLWTVYFFVLHDIKHSILILLFLLLNTFILTIKIWKRDALAGGYMLIYLGWLVVALILNIEIYMLNK